MRTSELRVMSVENNGGTFVLQKITPTKDDIHLTWCDITFGFGYLVSLPNGINNLPVLPDDLIEAVALTRLLDNDGGLLTDIYLGTWRNPETSLWSIDVSMFVRSHGEAKELSKKYGQFAFYGCKYGEVHSV